jgi:hypothetical protein
MTVSESFVLRAQKLATMSKPSFLATYGQVYRVIGYLPGKPDENVHRIFDLHRRHGREVVSVIDDELKGFGMEQALTLPHDSLLSMVVAPVAKQPGYEDPAILAMPAAARAIRPYRPILFTLDSVRRCASFDGGPQLTGRSFEVIAALVIEFDEDTDAGRAKRDFRHVNVSTLMDRLGTDDEQLPRQLIKRARSALERGFLAASDRQLDEEDVIQTGQPSGYRLNPYLVRLSPGQLESFQAMSQAPRPVVTGRHRTA